jgi:hypothetical protein
MLYLAPAGQQLQANTSEIQCARNHAVDRLLERADAGVEGRNGRKHDRARLGRRDHVAQVHEAQRRLAHDQDQPSSLLEHDVAGASDEVVATAMRDSGQRRH